MIFNKKKLIQFKACYIKKLSDQVIAFVIICLCVNKILKMPSREFNSDNDEEILQTISIETYEASVD